MNNINIKGNNILLWFMIFCCRLTEYKLLSWYVHMCRMRIFSVYMLWKIGYILIPKIIRIIITLMMKLISKFHWNMHNVDIIILICMNIILGVWCLTFKNCIPHVDNNRYQLIGIHLITFEGHVNKFPNLNRYLICHRAFSLISWLIAHFYNDKNAKLVRWYAFY